VRLFCIVAITVLMLGVGISQPRSNGYGTVSLRVIGECIHAKDKAILRLDAYKPYSGGGQDIYRDIVLRSGRYSFELPPDYYLATLYMEKCRADFDLGIYGGVRRAVVIAAHPIIQSKVHTVDAPLSRTLSAESILFSGDEVANVYVVHRSAFLIRVPYDGMSVCLKDAKGNLQVPITEGRANYFDDVYTGDLTLVVSGSTTLRSFPIKATGDFSAREINLTALQMRPPHVAPVLEPSED
jgi:hypothetical protein